ncbi:hypothetical protein [Ekhidna sp.]|uniref:hypothetical protein n=1 Tax=Ekhidna sp. TaxID=2608089 RepID=UPI00351293A2
MKRLSNLLAALVFASLVIFMSCGGGGSDPGPSVGETQASLFEGTWNVSGNPTYDNQTEGTWTGFTLTISGIAEGSNGVWGGNFTASGIPSGYGEVWGGASDATSVSGTWAFESATSVNTVIRSNDGVEVTITPSTTSLSTQFTVASTARTSGIFDELWVFQFTK